MCPPRGPRGGGQGGPAGTPVEGQGGGVLIVFVAVTMRLRLLLGLVLVVLGCAEGSRLRYPPIGPFKRAAKPRNGLISDTRSGELIKSCQERFRDTRLDWFSWANGTTFKQRYFVCESFWCDRLGSGSCTWWWAGGRAGGKPASAPCHAPSFCLSL